MVSQTILNQIQAKLPKILKRKEACNITFGLTEELGPGMCKLHNKFSPDTFVQKRHLLKTTNTQRLTMRNNKGPHYGPKYSENKTMYLG